MKIMNKLFFILCFWSISSIAFSQYVDTIYVGFNKSAYLFFDAETKFDAGSLDIKVRNPDNKIIIQAMVEDFDETNLLIECNHEYYLFLVRYDENPKILTHNYQTTNKYTQKGLEKGSANDKVADKKPPVRPTIKDVASIEKKENTKKTNDSIQNYYHNVCDNVLNHKQEIFNRGGILDKMIIKLENMYIYNNEFYFVISIQNKTKIPYEMDYIGFFVRDRNTKLKEIGVQDIQVNVKYIENEQKTIPGASTVRMVYVTDKFALVKGKKFNIEAWENNGDLTDEGGRKMYFSLYNKEMLNIKELE